MISAEFPTGRIISAERLIGGYWNSTLHLKCEKGEFVLRISPERMRPEGMNAMAALMEYFAAVIPEVPRPLHTDSGSSYLFSNGLVATLWPFLPGDILQRGDIAATTSAAGILGRLHIAGMSYPRPFERPGHLPAAALDWDWNVNWSWSEIDHLLSGGATALSATLREPVEAEANSSMAEIVARRHQIVEVRTEARDRLNSLSASGRGLVTAPVHGDYYPGNLLTAGGRVTAVLDWDECRAEWLIYELSRAIWEFCRDGSTGVIKEDLSAVFIAAYREINEALADEMDLLIPLVRVIRAEEVLFSLGEAARGQWWDPEYTLYNLVALDNL